MRIFRYWVRERREGLRQGVPIQGYVHGGSDVSIQLAREDLESRWQKVLKGAFRGSQSLDRGYEADIREEVVERIGPDLVVTRNRYGAEILNCRGTVFVDVDWYPPTFTERLFGRKKISDEERVRRVLPFFREIVTSKTKGIRGIRVYQTPRGMRVVIHCGAVDPRSPLVQAAMEAVRADELYRMLCVKQNCFRARLTAKPSRIRMRSLNQTWPVDEDGQRRRGAWIEEYRTSSAPFAACKFLETFGDVPTTKAIDLHDSLSGARSGRPLA